MKEKLENKIKKAVIDIKHAEYILISGDAGLFDAAEFIYTSTRFIDKFVLFIKYGIKDTSSSSFYPLCSQEEKWAYFKK